MKVTGFDTGVGSLYKTRDNSHASYYQSHHLSWSTEAGAGRKDNLFDVNFCISGRKAKFDRNDVTVTHQNIRSFFRRLSRECGFAVSPYRFRYTLATELMTSSERHLQLVKDLLGYCSVSPTMEYVGLQMDMVRKTLEAEMSLHTDVTAERNLQM
ncbi:hypothetical protein [Erwinia sp. 198]|uniref:hypothetical protein n=1 Tax=Erwinia sp. 198 TaxID=2022746 RepID=UPI001F3E486B|nr:hypothetical protein [Erwinia sp. 198]